VAVLLSPLTPVGLARIAEPDPGFAVDAWPLVLGAALVALLTMLAAAVPAWTGAGTATTSRERPGPGRRRSPPLPHALSRAWRSPAVAAGVRMALQPGRGRTAVPVRSAIFGATLGVAAVAASLVLSASLGHLLDTPRLSGFTWDAFVSVEGGLPKAAAALRADPKIAGYTRGGFTGVRIGQLRVMALVLRRAGPARLVITAGVAPTASDEVALGASTMRAAHTAIGQTVDLMIDQTEGHPKPARMRVVGTVIVPPTPFLATKLGDGAALALPGLLRIDPGAARQLGGSPFLVRFAPGVSRDAGLAAVANDIKGLPNPYVNAAERPASVVSLASIAGLPVALAGLLALIAAGTLAHTLASSTRPKAPRPGDPENARVRPVAAPAGGRVAGHHDRRDRADHRAARRSRRRAVGVALSRHPARRAARASRPAHRDPHRHSRRTGPGEPHRSSPGAGSRAHPGRHHPQNRIRKGEPAAQDGCAPGSNALTSSRISRRSAVPTTGAAAHRSI
jgi:hypothetical protein